MSSIEKAKKIIEIIESVSHEEIVMALKETNSVEDFNALIALDKYKKLLNT